MEEFRSFVPTSEELGRISQDSSVIVSTANNLLSVLPNFEEVVLSGSAAKGTCWSDSSDLDLFIVFKDGILLDEYEKAKILLVQGLQFSEYYEDYCSSPYLRARLIIGGRVYSLDWVPCFSSTSPNKSKLDHTLAHTVYVNSVLSPKDKEDVVLLKSAIRNIGGYGAESGGLSGYCCEVLIDRFRSVELALEFVADLTKPLFLSDPTRADRNIAACVQQRIRHLIADWLILRKRGIPYDTRVLFENIEGDFVKITSPLEYYRIRRAITGISKMYKALFVLEKQSDSQVFIGVLKWSKTRIITGPKIDYLSNTSMKQEVFSRFIRSSTNIFCSGANYYRVNIINWQNIFKTWGISVDLKRVSIYLKKDKMQVIGNLNGL